jgi:CxxC motif-containing protein
MTDNLICLSCPLGCQLEVDHDDKKLIEVRGNRCPRGPEYAEKEIFHPERIVTTTVRITGAAIPLLPVKTDKSVPKALCFRVIEEAAACTVRAPVRRGQALITNLEGTGVNLVAARSLNSLDNPEPN